MKHGAFPLVSVQVQHGEPGNMHPYNFETQNLFFIHFCCQNLLLLLIDLGQDIVRSSKQFTTKQPARLTMCWTFCNKQSTRANEDNDEMKELLGIHYVSIGHFFRYCKRI